MSKNKFCPACGAKHAPDMFRCRLCGRQLDLIVPEHISTVSPNAILVIDGKSKKGTGILALFGFILFVVLLFGALYTGAIKNEFFDRSKVAVSKQLSNDFPGWEILKLEGEPVQAGLPAGFLQESIRTYPNSFAGDVVVWGGKFDENSSEYVEFLYGNLVSVSENSSYATVEQFASRFAQDLGGTALDLNIVQSSGFTKSTFGVLYQGNIEPTEFVLLYEKNGRSWVIRSNSQTLFSTSSQITKPIE